MTLPLKVINLWAGPGAGKSTTAAGLFNLMKNFGHRVELVTEVAKDMTYERSFKSLENQLLVTAQQDQRLRRLVGQVEWVITDSPLPLGIAYMTKEYEPWLEETIWGAYDRYQNFDVLVIRTKEYAQYGRTQTQSEALVLDMEIKRIYDEAVSEDKDFAHQVHGDALAPAEIFKWLDLENS